MLSKKIRGQWQDRCNSKGDNDLRLAPTPEQMELLFASHNEADERIAELEAEIARVRRILRQIDAFLPGIPHKRSDPDPMYGLPKDICASIHGILAENRKLFTGEGGNDAPEADE